MPTTYALIPGAGGSAWYWHRVTPLLTAGGTEAIAIDLPADDDSADLTTYADTIYAALAGVQGPVILVAQSMGAFTAPMVAGRVRAELMVLVNPMVPTPGEAPGQWWEATGQEQARIDQLSANRPAAQRVRSDRRLLPRRPPGGPAGGVQPARTASVRYGVRPAVAA